LGEIVLFNIFYEIDALCTSIVARDRTGRLYHARNLDFGLFLGWNYRTHQWALTEKLRKMIFNVNWKRNGTLLYKSVNFAGYTGVYNAVKPNKFSVTANERFDLAYGGYVGLVNWLLGNDTTSKWMTWATRELMETANSYKQAVDYLKKVPLLSPVYFIVGGATSAEGGSIITRRLNDTLEFREMGKNDFYILQTNYDPWLEPLFIDDRRAPGRACMDKLGQSGVGFEGIFTVLSSKTNLNALTAYTTMMRVDDGHLETWVQECPQPCWFA